MKYSLGSVVLGISIVLGSYVFLGTPSPIILPNTNLQGLPVHQANKGLIISNDGAVQTPFTMVMDHDNETLSLTIKNKAMHFEAQMDDCLHAIIESEEYLTQNNTLKFTKKTINSTDTGTFLRFYSNENLIKEKEIKPSSPLLSIGTLIPYLQSACNLEFDEFSIEWILPNVFWTQRLYVTQKTLLDIEELPRFKKIPTRVTEILKSKGPLTIYTLKPKGPFSFLIRDPYYFIFEKEAPYSFVASWGGPAPNLMYQIIP